MALSVASSSQSGSMWIEMQQQMAQRNAEQAEQQARSLQARARAAQSNADRAQENARSLKLQSGQAEVAADSARQDVVSMQSANRMVSTLNTQIERLTPVAPPAASSSTVASASVVNAYGQQTGTLLNVTA